jgi:UDP-N-acetylglucosamine 2-epimerase (non-hydrolysing)
VTSRLRIAVLLGTRPELIKCAPVVLEARRRGVPVGIVHTGQHYTPELDSIFFRELDLPDPIEHVHVGSHPGARQIGLMIERLSDVLDALRPESVLVEGDTNSVLAGALTAQKLGIPIAHLEAGLRSDDWTMPEEANRVLTDRLSRWLFCPTDLQRDRLAREGITHDGVAVVGNTIVDAALHYVQVARDTSRILGRLNVRTQPFVLLTLHRPSNVDDPARRDALLSAIAEAARRLGLVVVFPVHPRTGRRMRGDDPARYGFIATEPLGYVDLLRLQSSAALVMTDSGGIQEEACILRVPSITLRANTERPEALHVGATVLQHEADADALTASMRAQIAKPRDWSNPFGDGHTAERVVDRLVADLG